MTEEEKDKAKAAAAAGVGAGVGGAGGASVGVLELAAQGAVTGLSAGLTRPAPGAESTPNLPPTSGKSASARKAAASAARR